MVNVRDDEENSGVKPGTGSNTDNESGGTGGS